MLIGEIDAEPIKGGPACHAVKGLVNLLAQTLVLGTDCFWFADWR